MTPPPGPFRPDFWRSPIRSAWLASVFAAALLPLTLICTITGFASHFAYEGELGRNATFDRDPVTKLLDRAIDWPAGEFLFAVNQGLHTVCGVLLIPILLAKLWSVAPKLFEWPPVKSLQHGIERAGLGLLVGGGLLVLATGVINLQYWYPFGFPFVPVHYYAAVVFIAALAVHIAGKIRIARFQLKRKGLKPLKEPTPAGGTISRRGAIATVGAGALLVGSQALGQSVGGPLREIAQLAPRGDGNAEPGDFPVNKTAQRAGITDAMVGADWRLTIEGGTQAVSLSRDELLALEQHTARLPIACVEGWSTTQDWTGPRLRDLCALAGVAEPSELYVGSLQKGGAFRQVTLNAAQANDDNALLALAVNGADLSMDHGYPARIIVPGAPGVHNTKWVAGFRVTA
jgi:DMSO/TMAO reductase YedYZ molybdopterin-dependent catalytic subunit